MGEKNSYQLRSASTRTKSQTTEISQENTRETTQAKEHTSSIIGWILRGGVILSAAIILLGFLLLLAHAGGMPGLSVTIGSFPHTLGQVWSGLLTLQPQAIIVLGLLFLIAVPMVTVVMSIVAFALERDRRFVVIAAIVLVILLTSLLIGKGGG
jgi:uncharacterized protein